MLLHRTAERVIVHPEAGQDVQDVRWLAARRAIPIEVRADLRYACVGLMRASAANAARPD